RPSIVILFFQAEDGIRDRNVTGVQTCALPISASLNPSATLVPRSLMRKGSSSLLNASWACTARFTMSLVTRCKKLIYVEATVFHIPGMNHGSIARRYVGIGYLQFLAQPRRSELH